MRSALSFRRSVFWSALLFLGLIMIGPAMAQIEEPQYKIIVSEGDFELRDYAPYIVAEVVIEGDRDSAVNAGFRVLAGYIFGGNTSQSKIAMTAPVTQSKGEKIEMTAPVTQTGSGSSWVIRFMMPQTYTMSTLPKPDDERIALKQIKSRRVAVLKFSGLWTEGNLNTHREELAAIITKKSLKPKGEATYAFYDPPWKPFFWRRNEVMQDIEGR
jgi:hypothetical protein